MQQAEESLAAQFKRASGLTLLLLAEDRVPAAPRGLRLVHSVSKPDEQYFVSILFAERKPLVLASLALGLLAHEYRTREEAAKGCEGRHSGWRVCGLKPGCLFPCYF